MNRDRYVKRVTFGSYLGGGFKGIIGIYVVIEVHDVHV